MATKTRTKKKPARKPRQKRLPGMEREGDEKLECLIEDWRSVKLQRVSLSTQEKEKRTAAENRMKEKGINRYVLNGSTYTLDTSMKLKETKNGDPEDDDGF